MNAKENAGLPRWKRALDVMLIVLTLPLSVPVMVFVALIIRVVSRGPILFRQERVGYRGERFMCLKFRTMQCGAETLSHQGYLQHLIDSDVPMIKLDSGGDFRVIPFGKLLRAAGLDELPQLFNVLNGEMSLVGPRPCLPYEAEQYLPWQRERFNAVPGLTGLWQVNGKNQTTFTRMIQLDIEYVRNRSLWLDLKIMARTVPALLMQIGDLRLGKKLLHRAVAGSAMPVRVVDHWSFEAALLSPGEEIRQNKPD
jgi:exopolysaccharide production protein ExoY